MALVVHQPSEKITGARPGLEAFCPWAQIRAKVCLN